jgi:3D (Asp-Asp-Asp) domain-containing protein
MLTSKKRAQLGLFLFKHMKNKYFSVVLALILMAPSLTANAVTLKDVNKKIINEFIVQATAYSSTPDQTDDTPFIVANGTFVHDGVVAANFLPFGTTIKIPEVYGDKVFIVEDRMHRRFQKRIDIWFPDRRSALRFGYKELKIQILEN